jgi:hypothetical protein
MAGGLKPPTLLPPLSLLVASRALHRERLTKTIGTSPTTDTAVRLSGWAQLLSLEEIERYRQSSPLVVPRSCFVTCDCSAQ